MTLRRLEPMRRSSWSFQARIGRAVWAVAWRALGLNSALRIQLIRLFGGHVGPRCRIEQGVDVAVPWNLRLGSGVHVGTGTILYSLGSITLEDGVRVDARAHLCAGTHDHRAAGFPLVRSPIHIEADALVGAAAFIGPGVRIGARAGVAPQAAVFRDVESDSRVCGNPAALMLAQTVKSRTASQQS